MSSETAPFPPVPAVGHVTHMRAANPLFVGVFVEGPDDVELWNRWLRHRPLPCDGCVAVRRAIASVRSRGLNGCVGIVDADFERVSGHLAHDDDIVVSEKHDQECDLICSVTQRRAWATLFDLPLTQVTSESSRCGNNWEVGRAATHRFLLALLSRMALQGGSGCSLAHLPQLPAVPPFSRNSRGSNGCGEEC